MTEQLGLSGVSNITDRPDRNHRFNTCFTALASILRELEVGGNILTPLSTINLFNLSQPDSDSKCPPRSLQVWSSCFQFEIMVKASTLASVDLLAIVGHQVAIWAPNMFATHNLKYYKAFLELSVKMEMMDSKADDTIILPTFCKSVRVGPWLGLVLIACIAHFPMFGKCAIHTINIKLD